MSVTYNDDGYPIYSGGNGGYAENANVNNAINEIYENLQEKLFYAKCVFDPSGSATDITMATTGYGNAFAYDSLNTNDLNKNYFTLDAESHKLVINKTGKYLINASYNFGISATQIGGAGIYIYKNDDNTQILSATRNINSNSVGAIFTGSKVIELEKNEKLYVKPRLIAGTNMTVYTKRITTYLQAIYLGE